MTALFTYYDWSGVNCPPYLFYGGGRRSWGMYIIFIKISTLMITNSDKSGEIDNRGGSSAVWYSRTLKTPSCQPGQADSGKKISSKFSNRFRKKCFYLVSGCHICKCVCQVRMKFGETEIKATAVDLTTGQVLVVIFSRRYRNFFWRSVFMSSV